jgi:hypothetical protein
MKFFDDMDRDDKITIILVLIGAAVTIVYLILNK